jgi:hypothetical protein
MGSQWTRRRAHSRRSRSGGTILVSATWELRLERSKRQASKYRHPCPDCGAAVVSVHMKRGGWAHFEGAKGLGRVKHPCFNRGEGLGRRRDSETPDLFDESTAPDDNIDDEA